jgi:Uma2 family endonuclease
MSTRQAISIDQFWEEYADSDTGRYEYDHGQLIELPMPDWLHGIIFQRICALLDLQYPAFAAAPEVDSKLSTEEVRRPDIGVQRKELIQGRYPEPDSPLYLAIEVLSPGRTLGRRRSVPKTFAETVVKYQKSYAPWGVPYCWILDPHSREAWHNANDFRAPVAELIAGEIRLACEDIFSALEQIGKQLT